MNALELAEAVDADLCFDYDEVTAMLRKQHAEIQEWRNVFGFLGTPDELGNEWNALKGTNNRQHEAIVKLREVLQEIERCYGASYYISVMAACALKDTVQFDSKSQPAFTEEIAK